MEFACRTTASPHAWRNTKTSSCSSSLAISRKESNRCSQQQVNEGKIMGAAISRHSRSETPWLVLLLFLPFLEACTRAVAQSGGTPPPPPKISVAEVVDRNVTEWVDFNGRLEAVNSVAIRPRVSGYISAVSFRQGGMVRRGDLLFEIDSRPFQAKVDRLTAELARVRATVQRAQREIERANRLSTEEAMSDEERDRRKAFAKESAAQVSEVEAVLHA